MENNQGLLKEELKAKASKYEKEFPFWLHRRQKVISLDYEQQKLMYDKHMHKCEDRNVSLEQPMSARYTVESVQTLWNLVRNYIFLWWMGLRLIYPPRQRRRLSSPP